MTRTSAPPKTNSFQNTIVRVQSFVLLVSVIAVGVIVTPGTDDVFRLPKNLWVRGEAIAVLACWIVLAIYGVRPRFSKADRPVVLFTGAAVGWTWLTAALSTNRALSLNAAVWTSAIAMLLLTHYIRARDRRRTSDLWFLILPGCLNALLAISQSSKFWNPFTFTAETQLPQRITALVGNPNELGSYLTLPFVVTLALAIGLPQKRWLFSVLSFICLSGLFASRTRTAMIGAAAGAACLVWIAFKRRALAAAAIAVGTIAIVLVVALGGFVTREDLETVRRIDGLNAALSGRITPALAAWKMFEDHPLFGVGPGAYSFWFFDYKIAVERDHTSLFHKGQGFSNFGEAHNDHAQLFAETGFPGYAVFLAILIFVGSHSFGVRGDSEPARLGRLLAFPVSAALFVLCLAQFPLHVASASISFGFVLTTVLGWLRR